MRCATVISAACSSAPLPRVRYLPEASASYLAMRPRELPPSLSATQLGINLRKLTTIEQRLVNICPELLRHAKYVTYPLAGLS